MPASTARSALFARGRRDWATPNDLFSRLNAQHAFTLDAAASADNACCATWFGVDDDGLAKSWAGHRVWVNPPYGRDMLRWVRKAVFESSQCPIIVMLVPSRTDTAWWHEAVVTARPEFLRGRLRFKGASSSAPFPSALLRWSC